MKCFQFSSEKRIHEPQPRRSSFWRSTGSSSSEKAHPDANSSDTGDSPGSVLERNASQRPQLKVFTYVELKIATRNFYRGNLLGEGGFGCVYRGVLKGKCDLRNDVAVKQLNRRSLQGHKEWLTEVNFLGRIEHANLVKLVGYCAEDDERGIQRLLVYEFMPNKSLEDHLFTKHYPVLSWRRRVQIALGAAQCLAYLHEGMENFQVIYRDFKTSNVLLDNDFNPKLSDFGLARLGPSVGDSHVSTAVVGTVGYAAPEYIQTGHLTAKSDVWSFGIVLLELLTGRKAMDKNRPKNEQRLLNWVRPYLADGKKFSQLMDPRLDGQYPVRAAYRMASLASQCLQRYPRMRPKMSDAVEMLKNVEKFSVSEEVNPPAAAAAAAAVHISDAKQRSFRDLICSAFVRKEPGFLMVC